MRYVCICESFQYPFDQFLRPIRIFSRVSTLLHTAGYAEDCYELHKFLLRQHISGFRFESIEDDGFTGNFEVYVNDVLVHSKATMPGHGRASSLRERNRILAAMQTGD